MENSIKQVSHTPGPWRVRFFQMEEPEAGFFVEANNNNMPELGYGIEILGDDFGDHCGYPTEQRKADAYLIAASPTMYKALKSLMAYVRRECTVVHQLPENQIDFILEEATKAIQLAEGRAEL